MTGLDKTKHPIRHCYGRQLLAYHFILSKYHLIQIILRIQEYI